MVHALDTFVQRRSSNSSLMRCLRRPPGTGLALASSPGLPRAPGQCGWCFSPQRHLRNIWGAVDRAAGVLQIPSSYRQGKGGSRCPMTRCGYTASKWLGQIGAQAAGSQVQASNPHIGSSLPCRLNCQSTDLPGGNQSFFFTAPLRF